ncbi:hypothetical protein [Streptomyces ureilyticus]|uniref:Uncharacterized protein n=1 Tax=Streptomyces ureilyticus TaxID=1775131 RepID=A0ABX0DW15_9ACTN|nr:hypothetical protein [Streptomyces ureilyticus]NGO43247.1 hypothetical protein [Streptomyces ureilyticus]
MSMITTSRAAEWANHNATGEEHSTWHSAVAAPVLGTPNVITPNVIDLEATNRAIIDEAFAAITATSGVQPEASTVPGRVAPQGSSFSALMATYA